ncbi:MAG: histidinol-phosphate transaminase [Cyclobacteriaceae bacterium]|nr:histidinol-phosphate transaminase [Cyclobacteriaceae bacterium]
MKKLEELVRPHILHLTPYSSARDEFSGSGGIFLDANENSFGSVIQEKYNRYPDPHQQKIKQKLSRIKKTAPDQIFLGNGSDEPIDLIIRLFCIPAKDNVVVMPPTYDMYSVTATLQEAEVRKVSLTEKYEIDVEEVFRRIDGNTKIIFICSPNNPTGNSFSRENILKIIGNFQGITVIDEAYMDFSDSGGFLDQINDHRNLVILQTLSKAWGLAGLRLGIAYADKEIIKLLDKIKFPYNINQATQEMVLEALEFENRKNELVRAILDQREFLENELKKLRIVEQVYPSDANFLLVRFRDAARVFQYLLDRNIIVRNRSKLVLCENSLRITAGIPEENAALIDQLKKFENEA